MSNETKINRRTFNDIAQQVLLEAVAEVDHEIRYQQMRVQVFVAANMPERAEWSRAKIAQAQEIKAVLIGMRNTAAGRVF